MMKFVRNSSMKLMTTLWLTASPTPFGTTAGVQPLVGGDERGDQPEDHGFELADVEVGQLGQCGEGRQVGARSSALQDHVEEVAADDADHGHQAVEEERHEHRRQHARHDQALQRADAEHLHRVDLVADLAGAEVGADGRAAGAGDEQRGDDRARLADDAEDGDGTGEALGADLLGQVADLQREHGPKGMETSAVGRIVTDAMNQACWMNSAPWKGA
jgi:hypothetical protein